MNISPFRPATASFHYNPPRKPWINTYQATPCHPHPAHHPCNWSAQLITTKSRKVSFKSERIKRFDYYPRKTYNLKWNIICLYISLDWSSNNNDATSRTKNNLSNLFKTKMDQNANHNHGSTPTHLLKHQLGLLPSSSSSLANISVSSSALMMNDTNNSIHQLHLSSGAQTGKLVQKWFDEFRFFSHQPNI